MDEARRKSAEDEERWRKRKEALDMQKGAEERRMQEELQREVINTRTLTHRVQHVRMHAHRHARTGTRTQLMTFIEQSKRCKEGEEHGYFFLCIIVM